MTSFHTEIRHLGFEIFQEYDPKLTKINGKMTTTTKLPKISELETQ